ncbi:3'-5' exonuclease [Sphingomonas sp. ABOLE]|uniref:3'-5' exonuclease n=1 Tax=Sphingomonas sp. ABOLE TaxID=1985878 RepID=UPI001F49B42F|nr:3'-5' exonuclease [Sphingomonas sp. ABOLE]
MEAWNGPAPEDCRILTRLRLEEGPTGRGSPIAPGVGVVVDVETTGLNLVEDVIIELAMRRFRYDERGQITAIGRRWCWLEDPGRPISREIAKLTGLNDAMLAGERIDERAAVGILGSASLVVAHNASFDRPRVEARLPAARGFAWACSCNEVDWRELGFDGRSLGYLLMQIGHFNGAHRASDDVDSTIALLAHELPSGGTVLEQLVSRSFEESWMVRAFGAPFDAKDVLRARGYRWDAERKVWWREVADRDAEEAWLTAHVYANASTIASDPLFERVTNRERWA